MEINYIELAKKNRVKALGSLQKPRKHFSIMSEATIQTKPVSRIVLPFFISARNSGAFSHANLH